MDTTPIKPHFACVGECVASLPHRNHKGKMASNAQPLGTITKLRVSLENQGIQKNDYNSVLARVERFSLQNIACDILPRQTTNQKGKVIKHRVNSCLRSRISKKNGVTVFYNEKREKAQYGNLQLCGSVWTCPVCAMRISEGRREELKQSFANWRSKGGFVYLMTFTNRHHMGDDLHDLVDGQKKALQDFWKKTRVQSLLKTLGYKGRITATEVTYSENNGWHPHYHMLLFFDGKINEDSLKNYLATEWQKSCVRVGMKEPSLEHGVDVRDGTYADKYVSKWGLEHEMTKWHTKKGREDSLTPWDFLRKASEEPTKKRWSLLFRQYAECFHGLKQLLYSRGLKELLEVETSTDEELAETTELQSVKVNELALQIWELILQNKARSQYLHAVELDYKDKGTRADDMVMSFAQDYITELINHADTT